MKKTLIVAILLSASFFANAQNNKLLTSDFWKSNPDLNTVKELIANGNDPAEQNGGFHDPVSMAINNGISNDVIKFLIDQKGNAVDKKTHHSRSYLHWASAAGNTEIMNYLISKGADVNFKDSYGTPIIAYAAASGNTNTDVYEILIKNGVKINSKFTDGANLIMLGVANDKDLKLTDYFISKGILINEKDDFLRSVADYAAKLGNIEIIEKLIAKGVKPTDQALFFATQGSRRVQNGIDVYEKLLKKYNLNATATNPDNETLLHVLARRNNLEIFEFFLDKNIDLNKLDKNGNTILMNASGTTNLKLVNTILSKTKNINSVNINNESALTNAFATGSAEIAALLIKNGAETNIENTDGNTLAYYWLESFRSPRPGQNSTNTDFTQKLNLLQKAKVNLKAKQANENTLLHLAIEKGNVELINTIAALGINVNAQDIDGNTVLHKAALTAKNDIILKALLKLGADKNLKTEFDETAFDLANQNEFLTKNNVSISFLK